HSRLKTPLSQPGAFFLHEGGDTDYEDYARQLVSEIRILEQGFKPRWIKRQRDNHFLDCEALAAAAAYVLNVQSIPEGVERATEGEVAAVDEPEPEAEAPPPSAAEPSTHSIRDRFRTMGARARR